MKGCTYNYVSVKVETRLIWRLISILYVLPLFDLRDQNLRALTCGAKNASVEIHPNVSRVAFDLKALIIWNNWSLQWSEKKE